MPQRRSEVLPDSELTEYAYALAKADRFQEAIDVLDMLDNPDTPRALNYRGYATRKLGHTDEGIGYYLKSVALDPVYPQVREYLGEAYVIEGKFDLAKDQLATIEKICGSQDCEYYGELAKALGRTPTLSRPVSPLAARRRKPSARAAQRRGFLRRCSRRLARIRAPKRSVAEEMSWLTCFMALRERKGFSDAQLP